MTAAKKAPHQQPVYNPATGQYEPPQEVREEAEAEERYQHDQLSHPVGGGTFAQALAAVKGGATVMLSINNRPAVKLGPVEAGATDWMVVDPVTNLPVPLAPVKETGIVEVDEPNEPRR